MGLNQAAGNTVKRNNSSVKVGGSGNNKTQKLQNSANGNASGRNIARTGSNGTAGNNSTPRKNSGLSNEPHVSNNFSANSATANIQSSNGGNINDITGISGDNITSGSSLYSYGDTADSKGVSLNAEKHGVSETAGNSGVNTRNNSESGSKTLTGQKNKNVEDRNDLSRTSKPINAKNKRSIKASESRQQNNETNLERTKNTAKNNTSIKNSEVQKREHHILGNKYNLSSLEVQRNDSNIGGGNE